MTAWSWELRGPDAWHAEEGEWCLEVWAADDGASWLWEAFDLSDEESDAARATGTADSAPNARRMAELAAATPT